MFQKYLWVGIAVIFSLGVYLLWPLTSDEFAIPVHNQLLAAKSSYLKKIRPKESASPNILWIVTDDLGFYDTDLYGEGLVSTPNIRRFGEEGIRFTNAYATSPICSPSRASMLTGRYNQRYGFEHQLHDRYLKNRMEYLAFKYLINSDPWEPEYQDSVPNKDFQSRIGLPYSEITIAEILHGSGYRTALMGKWHVSKHKDQSPQQFGFDEFYGFYASHSLYSPEGTSGIIDVRNDRDWTDEHIWSGQRKGLHAIEKNGMEIDEKRYLTQSITQESIDFIDRAGDQPFFLMASYNAPHTPFQVPQNYYDQFSHIEDPVKRVYQAMIKCLDDEIGHLISHLRSIGKLDNTLVFFVSDNGGAAYTYATDNGGLKGGKITNFEGGLRVPFAIWANDFLAGTVYEHPIVLTDLFTTSIIAAGLELPNRIIDGVDLLSKVQTDTAAHDLVFFRKGYNHAIRSGTHKLIWNERTMDTLLYHISADPFESQNVMDDQPEKLYQLLSDYDDWNKTLLPPSWPSVVGFNFTDEDGKTYVFEN